MAIDSFRVFMSRLYCIALLLVVMALSACTNQQIYSSIQNDQQLKCQQLPPSQYDECMADAGISYEQYKKEREEVLDQEPG